jgi:fructoselysine-6-P-deglycase FrlB-like protein
MADAIQDIPGCLDACLSTDLLDTLRCALPAVRPQRIFTVGCGTSLNAGQAAAYTCRTLLGVPAAAVDAYDFTLDTPPGVDPQALVISISQSGQSLTTCLAQEKARALGAFTVGITGSPASRLAQTAGFALIDPYRLEIPPGKTRSYLSSALLAMLACVQAAAPDAREGFVAQAGAMAEALRRGMPEWEAAGRAAAEAWAGITTHYMLAGFGVQKANADEIGLKFIEVFGEGATGFGLEEFTHGPHASFRRDLGIVLFQTDERALERALQAANGAALSDAQLLVLTDCPGAAWPQKARVIALPRLENAQQMGLFPAAVAAQYVMYYLAIAKGLNPDVNLQDRRPELADIYQIFFPPGTH